MFAFLSFGRREKPKKNERSRRLFIEELEARDCPAGSLTLNAVVQSGHMVQLSGTVTGANLVPGYNVSFSGAVSGSTTPDSSGNYSYTTSSASLGSVSAVGSYMMMNPTSTASTTIAVTAPVLSMSISYGSQRNVTLSGTVTTMDAADRMVMFTGAASGSATTDSTGHFSLSATASGLQAINAVAYDSWGQSSNTATVTPASNPPVIIDFVAINSFGDVWTFQGSVTDEDAAGLVIRFGGLDPLMGQTATVQANGTFSFTRTIAPADLGTATAITTDWWGQNSAESWCICS